VPVPRIVKAIEITTIATGAVRGVILILVIITFHDGSVLVLFDFHVGRLSFVVVVFSDGKLGIAAR
jgi:hypothetical protein